MNTGQHLWWIPNATASTSELTRSFTTAKEPSRLDHKVIFELWAKSTLARFGPVANGDTSEISLK
jgi:hypothetical protein